MFYNSRSFFVLFLFLCTSFLSANAAVNLVKKMLNSLNMATFIGVQHYSQPITRQLMISEARTALQSLPGGKKTKPAVVSALWAGGDKIFFASSAKGQGTVPGDDDLKIHTPVQDALKKCAEDFGKHNYDGKCGEIMVISEWLREHSATSLPDEKLIVAVDKSGVKPPCVASQERGSYGCEEFLHEMKFDKNEIIDSDNEGEACEVTGDGTDLGKRGCKKSKTTKRPGKSTTTKNSKQVHGSQPKHTKSTPRKSAARPATKKTKQRRSFQPRWNRWMAL